MPDLNCNVNVKSTCTDYNYNIFMVSEFGIAVLRIINQLIVRSINQLTD